MTPVVGTFLLPSNVGIFVCIYLASKKWTSAFAVYGMEICPIHNNSSPTIVRPIPIFLARLDVWQ